ITVCYKEPYKVVESGYAGFTFPIEIHLRNDGYPKSIRFEYTLFLGVKDWVEYDRTELVLFENPSVRFYEKLLKATTVSIWLSMPGYILFKFI
ncbi:hypothetical protein HELRODRAFT_82992, partial [Helobdella robusta]|uniref:YEATS domain-containing protein n=1 Tax=Helobdella robusta TaxID=6412 RepID=T1G4Z1_HELRO